MIFVTHIKTKEHKKRIIFLDIDGPICNERIYKAYGHDKKLISNLAVELECSVVISSSWRFAHDVPTILLTHGFDGYFHSDDHTERVHFNSDRATEIRKWLHKHPEVHSWVAIDDEESGYSLSHTQDGMKNNTVFCDVREGFSYKNYLQAEQILRTQINKHKSSDSVDD